MHDPATIYLYHTNNNGRLRLKSSESEYPSAIPSFFSQFKAHQDNHKSHHIKILLRKQRDNPDEVFYQVQV